MNQLAKDCNNATVDVHIIFNNCLYITSIYEKLLNTVNVFQLTNLIFKNYQACKYLTGRPCFLGLILFSIA